MTTRLEATVRLARDDDVEFLVELSARVFSRFSRRPRDNMIGMLRHPRSSVLVATAEIRLGFAVVSVREHPRAFGPWIRPATASLDAIAVRPSLSGRGVGRVLLEEAEHLARAKGAVSMSLLTAETNTAARALFERSGYWVVSPLHETYGRGQPILSLLKAL